MSAQSGEHDPAAPPRAAELQARLITALEAMPELQRQQVLEVVQEVSTFQGPIPPPAVLAGYNSVTPGAADRIIAMAEKEQAHRHDWEMQTLRSERRYSMMSLLAGWSVAVALAGAAAVVGIWGHWSVGVALAATSATGMVWKLIQGRSDEPDRKSTKTHAPAPPKTGSSKPKRR